MRLVQERLGFNTLTGGTRVGCGSSALILRAAFLKNLELSITGGQE